MLHFFVDVDVNVDVTVVVALFSMICCLLVVCLQGAAT